MRVLIIQPYARTPGHYDRETQRTCEAFARLGNDVTLVTYCGINTDGRRGPPPPFKLVSAVAENRNGGVPDYHRQKIYLGGLRAYLRWQIRDFRTSWMAARLLQSEAQSIAHFFNSDLIMLTMFVNLVLRGKRPVTLMTLHQIDRLFSPSRHIIGKLSRWLNRRCLARLIKRDLDGVVVLDPALKQALVTRLNINAEAADRIRVLPHGVGDPVEISSKEEARRRLSLQADETILLIFGVLRADKRIDLAIEAVKGLPQCRLLIVGGPQDFTEASIRQLAERHGCEGSVSTEVDYVPEQKMHDYFSACDAVIIPYASSFKGQSGILTLACGHGKPVIASGVQTLGEAVRKHGIGFAVEPDSVSALREAILRFLSLSRDERREIEQRVRSYARLMSWENTCKDWLELYKSLLDKRRLCSQP
jgi:glycosyltransferase involved in cell wall biosynthesis